MIKVYASVQEFLDMESAAGAQACSVVLLANDGMSDEAVYAFAEEAIQRGARTLFSTGAEAWRIHDLFDDAIVMRIAQGLDAAVTTIAIESDSETEIEDEVSSLNNYDKVIFVDRRAF